jgi:hypothetical protein
VLRRRGSHLVETGLVSLGASFWLCMRVSRVVYFSLSAMQKFNRGEQSEFMTELNQAEREFLDYLHQQFPATVGHISLKARLHNVSYSRLMEAAEIGDDRLHFGKHVAGQAAETIEYQKAIKTKANELL